MATDRAKLEEVLAGNWKGIGKISIDCDEGWFSLIEELHAELVQIDPNYQLVQVKEKFGGLRFYADGKEIRDVIGKYERLSFSVCEVTGNPGVLMRKHGVFKTLDPVFSLKGWIPI